jgi:hypothetical protein
VSGSAPHEHLPGCPAALSVPGAHDDCRCSDLAALFRVPTPDECFGDPDRDRGRARWAQARAVAERRHAQLMRELAADEQAALTRLRTAASSTAALERDLATARRLFAEYRASGSSWPR